MINSLLILLMLVCFGLKAQTPKIKNRELSFSIGTSNHNVPKFTSNQDLDFLNYVDCDPEYFEYLIVKLGYKFDLTSKISADIKLLLMDDLVPDNYDIIAKYHFNNLIDFGLGSILTKSYISNFEEYQRQSLPDYHLVDDNMQQFKCYEIGFYLTPMVKLIQSEWFQATIKCDMGMASYLKKEVTFYHKKRLSNERMIYNYKTKTTFQPYIKPGVDLQLQAFKTKNTAVGFSLISIFHYGKKSIKYERTIQKWTSQNQVNEPISPPKHTYSKLEINFGFYVQW
ncbi:MAG: hypothetical protein RBR35_11695 [Salinivirgaceae bacterium]|nr:hypothetical protein [Salinivirgaceae bacterium]